MLNYSPWYCFKNVQEYGCLCGGVGGERDLSPEPGFKLKARGSNPGSSSERSLGSRSSSSGVETNRQVTHTGGS